MSDFAVQFLPSLGRTTLMLLVAGIATAVLLRLTRATWPAAYRVGWIMTLLVGWTFLRLPVAIPRSVSAPREAALSAAAEFTDPINAAPPVDAPSETPASLAQDDGQRNDHHEEGRATNRASTSAAVNLPAISPGTSFDWPLAVVLVWALGIVGLVAAWCVGYLRFVRSLSPSLPAESGWIDQWRHLLSAAKVRRPIPLRVTANLGPMLCRLPGGYELLVPEDLWRELEIGQRGAILRHELAHYQRGDVLTSLAARVLALPHWFNPVSWWAVRRFEEAAEWACDRAATTETPATTYAKALILLGAQAVGPAAYGSAARGPALALRIRRLLTLQAKEDSTMKKTLLIAAGLCLAALSLVRLQLVAKEPEPTKPPLIEHSELNNSQSDAEPAAPAQAAQPTELAVEFLELQKKMAAEQLFEATKRRSRIASELNRLMVQVALAEARKEQGDNARPLQEAVDFQMSRDQEIIQANNQLGVLQKQLADEVAKGSNREDPGLRELRAKIDSIKATIEDRKAALRPHMLEPTTANPNGPAIPPLSMLKKEVQHLQQALVEVEKSISEKSLEFQNQFAESAARSKPPVEQADVAEEAAQGHLPTTDAAGEPDQAAESPTVAAENLEIERKTLELEKARADLEFTEKLLSKGYVTQRQRDYKAFEVKSAEVHLQMAQAARPAEISAASRKMVEEAQRAFEATLAAYESETTNMERVYEWSLRWMSAAEGTARQPREKIAAAKPHLERMRALQTKIKTLHDAGTKGGEAKEMAAANFYVAEAEGLLGRALAASAAKVTTSPYVDLPDPSESRKSVPQPAAHKRPLRYDNKSFDEWVVELRDDLSPDRRREAILALATFGAHGYGPQAAAQIIEAMRGYSVWLRDSSPEGKLKEAALEAFKKIPRGDALPLVTEALKSDNVNERLFAVAVLPDVVTESRDTVPILSKMLKDPNAHVRMYAGETVAKVDSKGPELVSSLRDALKSEDRAQVSWAATVVAGLGTWDGNIWHKSSSTILLLIPELVGLLNHANKQIAEAAAGALVRIGDAAIPELEKAVNAEDSKEKATKAEEVLRLIRERAAKEAK